MKVETREEQGVAITALRGRIDRGVGDEVLRETMNDLLADGKRRILLDLSEVPAIDSCGIGELMQSYKVCKELGADLRILRLPQPIAHVLSMSQILPLFQVYRTEEEALEAFAESS
jgi:anti-sigma B factor antagonist